MKKKAIISSLAILTFVVVVIYISNKKSASKKETNKKLLHKITSENKIRGCDGWGCGYYEASREERIHNGVDVLVFPGEPILSPIDGEMVRISYPYTDTKWEGVLIKNEFYEIKIWYFKPIIKPLEQIKKGQIIGYAQDITKKYSNTMKPHVHIEVKESGQYINPTNLFE